MYFTRYWIMIDLVNFIRLFMIQYYCNYPISLLLYNIIVSNSPVFINLHKTINSSFVLDVL